MGVIRKCDWTGLPARVENIDRRGPFAAVVADADGLADVDRPNKFVPFVFDLDERPQVDFPDLQFACHHIAQSADGFAICIFCITELPSLFVFREAVAIAKMEVEARHAV